jgi:hypothetical protein
VPLAGSRGKGRPVKASLASISTEKGKPLKGSSVARWYLQRESLKGLIPWKGLTFN